MSSSSIDCNAANPARLELAMFDVTMATCSDRGQRATNEDALRVGCVGVTHYAVLSDGAGGHARGAEASRRVVDHIETALRATEATFVPARLTQVLRSSHDELQREQLGAQGRGRMHATVVVLWIDGKNDRAIWSHVGDTRLYRLRYGAVDLVTTDDSVVQQMLEGGLLTPQQAQDHPLKNQLLAAIGMQDDVDPHTVTDAATLEDGDAFLLCTDGWWGVLDDADITGTLSDSDTPQAWLNAMHKLITARAAAGQDNFSAVGVWVCDPTQRTLPMADSESTIAAPLSGT
jgi:serine/threonine protein phosphatase PrpC